MTEILGNFPDIAGVIGYNDPSAIGAAAAARSQGKTDLVFGGQNGGSDAFVALKAGRLSYSAKLDPPSMGKFAAWGLYNLLQGKTVPKTVKAEAPGDRDGRERRRRADLGRPAPGGVRQDAVAPLRPGRLAAPPRPCPCRLGSRP